MCHPHIYDNPVSYNSTVLAVCYLHLVLTSLSRHALLLCHSLVLFLFFFFIPLLYYSLVLRLFWR